MTRTKSTFGDYAPKPGEDVYAREAKLYGLKETVSKKPLAIKAAEILRKAVLAGIPYRAYKLAQEKKAAEASQQAATVLQDKLKQVLIKQLPGAKNNTEAKFMENKVKTLIDNNNYKAARDYVADRNSFDQIRNPNRNYTPKQSAASKLMGI